VLERTLTESFSLELELPEKPLHVMVDPGQLDQLVMNLAVNARDAMPEGGRVTLAIERRPIESHPELAPGIYAVLSVVDTGVGMSEEVAAHVFEPFFTTKGDKGTGLGLATCYGIAKQAGGAIELRSAPGEGSTFTVLLPLCAETGVEAASPPAPAASEDPSPKPHRLRGLALVVEDQLPIRRTMARSLEGLGLSVLEAQSAEDALAMMRDLDARIDLLVTDVVLPGLSGIKLADELRSRQPELRILLCSGFVGHEQTAEALGSERTAFLPKPFSGPQVASKAASLFR
jgi:CheY-like chemotaxis protein